MNAFSAIALVAEEKIKEAMKEGGFDNLPGAGKPLVLEDLSHIPPEMRMAYTILKNSGHLAVSAKDTPACVERDLCAASPEEGATHGRMRRLDVMLRRVHRARNGHEPDLIPPLLDSPYLDKLMQRL